MCKFLKLVIRMCLSKNSIKLCALNVRLVGVCLCNVFLCCNLMYCINKIKKKKRKKKWM